MQNLVRPTLVAMATTFALGAESNRLPACHCFSYKCNIFVVFNGVGNSCLNVDRCRKLQAPESAVFHQCSFDYCRRIKMLKEILDTLAFSVEAM